MKTCNNCHYQFSSKNWTCPACGYAPSYLEGYLSFAPELAAMSEGFEAKFFPQLAKLESKNFWFRSRNHLIIHTIKHYFPKAQSFLEIGCGTGFVLQAIERKIPYLTLFGSEIFCTGLEFASKRLHKTTLLQMDACKIPFFQEFDLIGAFDVLEHIRHDQEALKQIYQATKPRGGIILTVPQHPWLWSQADDYAHHFRRYCAIELHQKVENAGFQVIAKTSFVSLILPLMLISRWRYRTSKVNYNPLSELEINPLINTVLESLLNVERSLLNLGVSLPVGGSLLLVAQKS
ncbi:class I SAM-dependent methyltransferase [Spirulina subsalsa FACHB-351]|uniref:Class I SAM-dependent methyltransferase n=1 Tax=Spirulina subsalsa FACHB-351 TaxID=234711 RepID=A0ABT3LAI1_9CYAN|nr:class I SAM-dependent methyltransferase [Spirulina subsalsa]MCW6038509.1 class I SAM-dependent methyltransferase [Spirulina subsalsa FACHB-351]